MTMSIAQFKVSYGGHALDTGRMNVKELAPAILAIGAVIEESNRLINPGNSRIIVNVTSFHDGSFGISFEALQTIFQQAIDIFSGNNATAAANLMQHIGFSSAAGLGLYKLIKKTKGNRPTDIDELKNGNVILHFSGDVDDVEVDGDVFTLYRNVKVRKEIENSLKPLEIEGIDSFQIISGDDIVDQICKSELEYYRLPPMDDEKIGEQETIKTFSIHSLSFKEDNKWRLSDGTNTFYVTISDKDFIQSVNDSRISFSKGDLLKVKLIERSWETEYGLKTDYEAIEILEHRKTYKQSRLI